MLVKSPWVCDELQKFRIVDLPRCVSSQSKIIHVKRVVVRTDRPICSVLPDWLSKVKLMLVSVQVRR